VTLDFSAQNRPKSSIDRDEPRLELEVQVSGIDNIIAVHDLVATTSVIAPFIDLTSIPVAPSASSSAPLIASIAAPSVSATANAPALASPPANLNADESLPGRPKRSLDSEAMSAAKKKK